LNVRIDKPLGMLLAAIGQPVRRREDQRLVTGKGRFTDDFAMDGQTYAAMVRSPHPHARIVRIDVAAARARPGVLGVFTGADCLADGLHPIPHSPLPSTKYDMKLAAPGGGKPFTGPHALLAQGKVRYVGEGVVFVVAETKAQALDAAEAVTAEYDALPWLADARVACEPGAPAVWEEAPNNVLIDTMFGDADGTDRAFAKADHVVTMDFHVPRVTAAAMEPRAALAHYDAATDRYTLHAGSGGAVKQKHEIAATLGIAPERLRILSLDVGGSFGSKNRPYVEFALALWASKKVGRPVKFTATRSETFLTDYQGRDLVTHVELALRKDGRFLAMRADNISNVGAHCVSLSPLGKGSALITGSYDIPVASLRARAVFTNTMPTNAYRSSGRPEVTFAIERLVDTAAKQLGVDRIKLRRKNLVAAKAMPYANAVGAVYDSGHYEENMDLAMRIADVAGFKERRKAAKKRGKLLGLGLANYVESSIGAPKERVEITVKPDGRVTVVIGTQPSGQGHETSFAQVVGDLLGLPPDTVDIVMGDTDIVSVGGGSHSGRSMRHAATVIAKAAPEMIARGKKIAALVLNTSADKIDFKDGRFVTAQSNRTFDLLDLAKEAECIALPPDLKDSLAVVADNEMHDPVFPNGCAVCEIEVDPDSGGLIITRYAAVDDVGRCINPMIVHGQTHGGIAQGVGEAMWELCAIDPDSGQPLCGSFMDYGMPRSNTLPSFETEIVEVLSPTNPLGIKAGGEGGTTPALAVIVNAIVDALNDYDVRDITMPTTPFTVWKAIQDAKARQTT
jgi:aerobic carbon-monoxide dehydrogenase large subunit